MGHHVRAKKTDTETKSTDSVISSKDTGTKNTVTEAGTKKPDTGTMNTDSVINSKDTGTKITVTETGTKKTDTETKVTCTDTKIRIRI